MKTPITSIAAAALAASQFLFFPAAAIAQTYSVLHSFGVLTNVTGWNPYSPLVQASDGTLYGTTPDGEGPVRGTVFRLNSDGTEFAVLRWFTNSIEGVGPRGGLLLAGSTLYGTTYLGGSYGYGTVFKINTNGAGYGVLKHFTGADGRSPYVGLTLSANTLYGTTYEGGGSGYGTVFRVNTDGSNYAVLTSFTGNSGATPGANSSAGLLLADNTLYGTTVNGGSSGYGTVFKVNTDGSNYMVLKNFGPLSSTDGAAPYSNLALYSNLLFGTTAYGGSPGGRGLVFRMDTNGNGYTVLKTFMGDPNDGANPYSGLTLSGNTLYGTTDGGGYTVFKINTDGGGYGILKNFIASEGRPYANLLISGATIFGTTQYGGDVSKGTVFKLNADGNGYSLLKSFTLSDASNPRGTLLLVDGALYGTTEKAGSSTNGTIFRVNTDGTGYNVLKSFPPTPSGYCNTTVDINSDGAFPHAGLTSSGGLLFGTAWRGGSCGLGTVFSFPFARLSLTIALSGTNVILTWPTNWPGFRLQSTTKLVSPSNWSAVSPEPVILSGLYAVTNSIGGSQRFYRLTNTFAVLKTFGSYLGEGGYPQGDLALSNNWLYGITEGGGFFGNGTVFKIKTDGSGYAVLQNFAGSDGKTPNGGLTLSGGSLYGTTVFGGTSNYGTLFKVGTNGTDFAVLKSFVVSDGGVYPRGRLALSGNTLFGILEGTNGLPYFPHGGKVFQINTDGNRFALLKDLASSNLDIGSDASAGLILSGNTLYGTTEYGGSFNAGTVFKINTDGSGFSVLKEFNSTDGSQPYASLTLSSNMLYGTTYGGGGFNEGVVFSLSLAP